MKKLSTYLFLFLFSFSAPSFADDISEFQIEGMSIGDSLLDYFTEKEILKNKPNWFKNNEYSLANNLSSINFETFKLLQTAYKTIDKKYILEGIEGYKFFEKIDDCMNEKKEVVKYVEKEFNSLKKIKEFTYTKDYSKYVTTFRESRFKFNSGDSIFVQCTSSTIINQNDLRVILRTKEYSYFLLNKAY